MSAGVYSCVHCFCCVRSWVRCVLGIDAYVRFQCRWNYDIPTLSHDWRKAPRRHERDWCRKLAQAAGGGGGGGGGCCCCCCAGGGSRVGRGGDGALASGCKLDWLTIATQAHLMLLRLWWRRWWLIDSVIHSSTLIDSDTHAHLMLLSLCSINSTLFLRIAHTLPPQPLLLLLMMMMMITAVPKCRPDVRRSDI